MGMNIGRGLGKFAEGLASGYAAGVKNRREQEEHDLRMQRAKDEQAMGAEIKKIADMKVAPTAAYVVTSEDGTSMTFGDAQAAADAAQSTPGAQVAQRIMVGTKQFDDMEDAKNAAEAMNSPAAKSRMMAQVGLKYNRPDVHEAHMKAYKMTTESARADMMEAVMMAEQTGDPKLALEAYNSRLPNGMKAEMITGEDGSLALQVTKKGQPVGPAKPIKSLEEFFAGAKEFVNTTPDNYLEIWKHKSGLAVEDKKLGLQDRQVTAQEKATDASVRKTDADIANIPVENELKSRQVGAAETSASASATNADTARQGLFMPTPMSGVDDNNQVVVGGTQRTFDGKTWGLKVLPPQPVTGMKPTGVATMAKPKAGEFDALLGPGAPQQPLTFDWSKIPKRNLGQ